VWEWCRDGYGDYSLPVASVDGERQMPGTKNRVNRGGAYDYAAVFARSSFRYDSAPDYRSSNLGVRPARALEAASPQAASR
jgi:formylglycine-generating enzyme required for sulfatase activity